MQKLVEPFPTGRSSDQYWDHIWPICELIRLPKPTTLAAYDFFELLDERQSRRNFIDISTETLATLFWVVSRHKMTFGSDPNRVRTPVGTAGALASVQTLIVEHNQRVWFYEPRRHCAAIVSVNQKEIMHVRREAQLFFECEQGVILIFLADRKRVEFYYENPASLVLREAGVIIGTMALACEALGLAFCPLGTLGGEWANAILGVGEESVIPCGAAVIGGR